MLIDLTIKGFLDKTAGSDPVPGGGSISALNGSIAAALTEMVANLTIGRKKYAEVEDKMREVAGRMAEIRTVLANDIDYGGRTWGGTEDINGFDGTFDGGGYTISNMVIPASGLVEFLYGTVQNLVLDGVELQTANGYHGLIAGTNNGTIAGQTVFHFHLHLIPRYEGDQVKVTWPQGEISDDEKTELVNMIKKEI